MLNPRLCYVGVRPIHVLSLCVFAKDHDLSLADTAHPSLRKSRNLRFPSHYNESAGFVADLNEDGIDHIITSPHVHDLVETFEYFFLLFLAIARFTMSL